MMSKFRLEDLKQNVEHFNETIAKHKTTVKCISDQILLYIRYGLFRLNIDKVEPFHYYVNKGVNFENETLESKITKEVMHIYNELVRGNPEYTSKNPRMVAAATIYYGLKRFYEKNLIHQNNYWFTQLQVSEELLVNHSGMRTLFHDMRKQFKKYERRNEV